MGALCGAKNRAGNPCARPAGWGTDHLGQGKCKLHGGRSTGPPKGSTNAQRTGEHTKKGPSRAKAFKRACRAAPVDPATMLQEQARRTAGRLAYMFELLLQTEQRLEDLAAQGDGTALAALAIVEVARKQEPRTEGEGETRTTQLVDTELSTKSRALLDLWHQQHEAITRVELLYGRTAERLKPPKDVVPGSTGGIGTLIINAGIPGVDYDVDDGGG